MDDSRSGYPGGGVTVRQNNEPAGGQDVWHLHTHVIPRHAGARPSESRVRRVDDAERARYAARLRQSPSVIDALSGRSQKGPAGTTSLAGPAQGLPDASPESEAHRSANRD